MKKIACSVLSAVLMLGLCLPVSAGNYAEDVTPLPQIPKRESAVYHGWDDINKLLLRYWEKGITALMSGLAHLIPETADLLQYEDYVKNYTGEGFLPGMDKFHTTPGSGWVLGYDKRSLVPDDWREKTYYLAGYLYQNWPGDTLEEILDDMTVRTVVLGDGRNKIAFSVIDAIGIAGTDVGLIRSALAVFAQQNGIVSINVSATHTHSGIDTIGIWSAVHETLPGNAVKNLLGRTPQKAADEGYIAFVRQQIEASVKAAVAGETPGKLYIAQTDIEDYITDNRAPSLYSTKLTRLRFVPANGSRSTQLVQFAAHPSIAGLKTDNSTGHLLTADFPYYLCETIEKDGANAMFINADIAGIYPNRGLTNESAGRDMEHRWEQSVLYGQGVGRIALGLTQETEVEPILNVAHQRFEIQVEHPLIAALARSGLMRHLLLKNGRNRYMTVSEVGYLELGTQYKAAMFPGEVLPEIVTGGGAMTAENAFLGRAFAYPPLTALAGSSDLLCIGLCNDMLGYIIPDNDYSMNFLQKERQNSNQELITFGRHVGSTAVGAFAQLMARK